MENEFSILETQLVRSSLATKTTAEIAELLERPEAEVLELINDITGGAAQERERDVELYKKELEEKKRKKKAPLPKKEKKQMPTAAKLEQQRKAERYQQQRAVANRNEAMTVASRRREDSKKYQTRSIDHSKMRMVKVDAKTWISLPNDLTAEQVEDQVKQYHQRQQHKMSKLKTEQI